MPSSRTGVILLTLLAPCLWGTTYVVFTQTLPVEHPLLVAALRALPAGLLLMMLGSGLPPRAALFKLTVLGLANIGLFFALLFVSAARLPGGAAATLMSAQPLLVGLLAWPMLLRRPHPAPAAAARKSVPFFEAGVFAVPPDPIWPGRMRYIAVPPAVPNREAANMPMMRAICWFAIVANRKCVLSVFADPLVVQAVPGVPGVLLTE